MVLTLLRYWTPAGPSLTDYPFSVDRLYVGTQAPFEGRGSFALAKDAPQVKARTEPGQLGDALQTEIGRCEKLLGAIDTELSQEALAGHALALLE